MARIVVFAPRTPRAVNFPTFDTYQELDRPLVRDTRLLHTDTHGQCLAASSSVMYGWTYSVLLYRRFASGRDIAMALVFESHWAPTATIGQESGMSDVNDPVVTYFEETRWDYRHLWRSEKSGAMHFGYYDAHTRGHVQSLRRMTNHLAALAKISSPDRVMDAGCGLGGCAVWLARHRGCQVTGVNITPYQVVAARELAGRAGVSGSVEFVEADFAYTGLPGGAFTVVWALESSVHGRDKGAFLREAHRLLIPGGRLMISEYLLRDGPALTDAESADLRTGCEGWAMSRLLSEAEYRELLAEHGFDKVRVVDLSHNVAPSLRRLGRLVRLLGPTAPIFERLGVLGTVPAKNLRGTAALIRAFDNGTWRYKVVLAERRHTAAAPGHGGEDPVDH